MRIGILKTDEVRPEYVDRFGEYPDMFKALLSGVEPGLEFDVYDIKHGRYPDDPEQLDAFLITGSKNGVYDPESWIGPLENYVRELYEIGKPILAICFGHQLVARALGGRAGKSNRGWGVGVQSWATVGEPDWLYARPEEFRLLASHQDQVEALPEDAQLLAQSEFCPFAMFQVGDSVLAMQGHPEFSKEYSRTLLNLRRELIGENNYLQGIKSLDESIDVDLVAGWMLDFLRYAIKRRHAEAA